MSSSQQPPFSDLVNLTQLSENEFQTTEPPGHMGNAANIAYGGFAIAVAAKAACASAPSNYHLYTMMGNFLGPALTDRPLHATVTIIRQTRTFATRQVQVSQQQDSGGLRRCLIALADLQLPEQGELMHYSAPPTNPNYTHHSELVPGSDRFQRMADLGEIPQAYVDAFTQSFGLLRGFYDVRPCPEGIFAQNLNGIAKHIGTTQSSLPLTSRSTADWVRCLSALPTPADNVTALAFFMDSAISFAPLSFSNMFLDDSAACSSLDFALRVFGREVRMGEWGLRELTTAVGREGRTYSEARLWDERGECVASMTQTSILRPRKEEGKEGKKMGKGKL